MNAIRNDRIVKTRRSVKGDGMFIYYLTSSERISSIWLPDNADNEEIKQVYWVINNE